MMIERGFELDMLVSFMAWSKYENGIKGWRGAKSFMQCVMSRELARGLISLESVDIQNGGNLVNIARGTGSPICV